MGTLELALVGAFPFPLPQGSQIYFEDQARGLMRAGSTCTLLTYGRGQGQPPSDLEVVTSPAAMTPKRMRSGPSLGKPVADGALLRTLLEATAQRRFDAVLAHNAEAAAIALAARWRTGVPVVYVVHTLLGVELSAYLPASLARAGDGFGARVDLALAKRADGLIVLAHSAETALAPSARGPVALIPPGLRAGPAPDESTLDAVLSRHGLQGGGFFLYSGNLDGYQDLDLLADAARALPPDAPPIIVATHGGAAARSIDTGLRLVRVDEFAEMRALMHAAAALLLTRRRVGGYPIKLLNYMEAGRPIVAFADVAEGLVHGESAWLLDPDRDASGDRIASALMTIHRDAALATRIGRGAHNHLALVHDPDHIATATLDLIHRVTRKS